MGKLNRRNFCQCGCRIVVKNKWATGHHCRGVYPWNIGLTKEIDKRVLLQSLHQVGYKQTEEHRKNNSRGHLGQVAWNIGLTKETDERVLKYGQNAHNNKSHIGQVAWNTNIKMGPQSIEHIAARVAGRDGYRHSEETINKIKTTNLLTWSKPEIRSKTTGENSSSWLGGISKLPYSQDWTATLREEIRQRDNYQCCLCGVNQNNYNQRLDVHHINYDKDDCNVDNLVSLCISCHRKTNYNRDKWTRIFESHLTVVENVVNY